MCYQQLRRGIGMLRFLSNYLSRQTLTELYKLYVRPNLDYGDVIYHIPQKVNDFSHEITLHRLMERLESVQYSAGLAITGAWKGTSRSKIYEELGWESLNDRRWNRWLVLFFKFINKLTPEYTRYPIPSFGCSNYNLRNQTVIGRMNARTDHFGSSLYPNCLKEWNDLPPAIGESPTVASFKSKLFSLSRPPQKLTYGIYNAEGLAILTQLRVGLSQLKSHIFNHNFRETVDPMFLVNGGIEDTEHFLLQCHAYSEQRRHLLGAINEVFQLHNVSNSPNQALVQTMLYCDERFTYNQNRQISEATVQFIRTPERFS